MEIMGEVVHVDFKPSERLCKNTTECEVIHVDFVGLERFKCFDCGSKLFHLINDGTAVCTNCKVQVEFIKGAEVHDD
jgi:DNA-directed RNA polymerase subunit RPC12/RpoP